MRRVMRRWRRQMMMWWWNYDNRPRRSYNNRPWSHKNWTWGDNNLFFHNWLYWLWGLLYPTSSKQQTNYEEHEIFH
jgi:hypothetical protein